MAKPLLRRLAGGWPRGPSAVDEGSLPSPSVRHALPAALEALVPIYLGSSAHLAAMQFASPAHRDNAHSGSPFAALQRRRDLRTGGDLQEPVAHRAAVQVR